MDSSRGHCHQDGQTWIYLYVCYLLDIQIPGRELQMGQAGIIWSIPWFRSSGGHLQWARLVLPKIVSGCWVGKNNRCVLLKSIFSGKNMKCHISIISIVLCIVILELFQFWLRFMTVKLCSSRLFKNLSEQILPWSLINMVQNADIQIYTLLYHTTVLCKYESHVYLENQKKIGFPESHAKILKKKISFS